jgi:drug/metabolite transporter (DMT)-like permease
MNTSALVVLSEAALSLYPILIKKVDTNLATQLVSRLVTYSTLGFALSSSSDIKQTWGTSSGILRSGLLGFMTLLHITSSYLAFQELPAGISMSLFYSYPIFNLIGASLGFGEKFGAFQIFLITLAFIGVLLVSYTAKDESDPNSAKEGFFNLSSLNWVGILAGLTAAITESGMYFAVKTAKQPNPFYAVLELYPAALPLLLAGIAYFKEKIDFRLETWIPMILFNAIVGFVGYCLRFYAIPRVPTFLFSILSFIGIITSFIWGYFFVGEVPSWLSVIGGSLIGISAGLAK